MQLSKTVRLLMALSLAGLLVAGCGGSVRQTPPAPPLRVEWTLWEGDYTLVVAHRLGLFEKHGVQVEPVYYENYSAAVRDLAGGKIDGALLELGDLLQLAKLIEIKAVIVYDSGGISAIVAAPDIRSLADLRGKRIGVNLGGSSEMIVRSLLQQNGIGTEEVIWVEVDAEEVPAAIPVKIDAGYTWEPHTTDALGRGYTLLYTTDIESLAPDVVAFHASVVAERPQDIRAFAAAWFEAVEYRRDHPAEALSLIMQETGLSGAELGLTGDDKLYTLEDNLRLFADPPEEGTLSIYQIAQINVDFLTGIGDLTERPDLKKLFDPAHLR